MGFQSILGVNKFKQLKPEEIIMPQFFYDLNLDQIVLDIMDHQKLYDIRKYYYVKAKPEDIRYRMAVFKDLENNAVFQGFIDFSLGMRKAKEYLNNITESDNMQQKQKWKLDAASFYINSVKKLSDTLSAEDTQSEGLISLREWLDAYQQEEAFLRLKADTEFLMSRFDEMKFNLQIKRDHIIVRQGYLEEDYCRELLEVFKKQEDTGHYYQNNPFGTITLSSLEAAILDILKKPYAEVFEELMGYDGKYSNFFSEVLCELEKEIQFYITFRMYRDEMEEMGFHFCCPKVGEKEFRIMQGYDLALARKNAAKKKEVVFNDCSYENNERFFVITGPNQGGKTTFARALGQILYFGSLGLMVPAASASFPDFDRIYTHFAAEESMETGAGKLKEELLRLRNLMNGVTKNSFVIINEIFTSATSYDAYIMGKRVLDYFMEQGCYGVYVTHIYELTKDEERIASLVASLLSDDSTIRTFKIERRKADGRSYANTIVEKYHMTYGEIKERMKR